MENFYKKKKKKKIFTNLTCVISKAFYSSTREVWFNRFVYATFIEDPGQKIKTMYLVF